VGLIGLFLDSEEFAVEAVIEKAPSALNLSRQRPLYGVWQRVGEHRGSRSAFWQQAARWVRCILIMRV
jgi:hypothetical protein